MRAIGLFLTTLGSTFRLNFLIKMGQGLSRTAVIGERASEAKRAMNKPKKDKTESE